LVWAGYVLSSAGTATLTVAILKRHYEKRLDNMEKMIKDLHDKK
jgi:predicted DNA-binding transcriptional regulator